MLRVMLEQAAEGKDLQLYADPEMVRNQLYVDDCCNFIYRSAKLVDKSLGIVNLASSTNCVLEDIVKAIVAASGKNISYKLFSRPYKGKDMRLDASKRKKYLGEETYTLIKGIEAAYEWIQNQKAETGIE